FQHSKWLRALHLYIDATPEFVLAQIYYLARRTAGRIARIDAYHDLPDFVGCYRHGRTKLFGRQAAGSGQEGIAQHFGFEPPDAHATEKPIFGIDGIQFGSMLRRLPISGRGDDHSVQALELPAAGHEVVGQPIKQRRVRRRLTEDAEVCRSGYEAAAE